MLRSAAMPQRRSAAIFTSRPLIALAGATAAFACGLLLLNMSEIAFHIWCSLVMVGLSLVISYFSCDRARFVNPAFFFVAGYVIQVYAGILPIYLENPYADPNLIAGALLSFAIGAYLTGSHWRRNPQAQLVFGGMTKNDLTSYGLAASVAVGMTIVVVFAYVAFRNVGVVVLSRNINGAYEALSNETPRYTEVLLYNLPMVLGTLALGYGLRVRSRGWIAVVVALALAFVVLIAAISRRYPVFYMAIALLIVLGQFGRFVRLRNVLLAVAGAAVIVPAFTFVGLVRSPQLLHEAEQKGYLIAAYDTVVGRLLYSQAHVVSVLMTNFPRTYGFFNGFTLADQLLRVPGTNPTFSFGAFLYPLLAAPFFVPGSDIGYAPPTLFGEYYANFGTWMTFLLMGFTGALFALFERYVRPLAGRNHVALAAYAGIAMYLVVSSTEGVATTVHSIGYVLVLVLIFGVVLPAVAVRIRQRLQPR